MSNHYYQTGDRVRAKYVEENAPDHNATGTIIGPPNDKNTYPVKLDHPINWGYANIDDYARYKEYELEHIQTHEDGPFDTPDAPEQDHALAHELRLNGNEDVNHPAHYTSDPSGIECIQITRWRNFNIGNAFKYLWRAGLKDTDTTIQDLQKAVWYIRDEINRLEDQ